MKFKYLIGAILIMTTHLSSAQNISGLELIKSQHNVSTTADKLEAVLTEKGMKIFARIDHAAGLRVLEKNYVPLNWLFSEIRKSVQS